MAIGDGSTSIGDYFCSMDMTPPVYAGAYHGSSSDCGDAAPSAFSHVADGTCVDHGDGTSARYVCAAGSGGPSACDGTQGCDFFVAAVGCGGTLRAACGGDTNYPETSVGESCPAECPVRPICDLTTWDPTAAECSSLSLIHI